MAKKLLKYRDMLCNQLAENPFHSASWVGLGLQYLNDDDFDNAEKCFLNGIYCADTAYLPFKEYSFFLLRKAKSVLLEAHKRTHQSHNFAKVSEHFIKEIQKWNIDLPKVDTGGISISNSTEFPHFPTHEEIQEMINKGMSNELRNKDEEDKI